MKALVLCGGMPQIYLMQLLRERGITVILADMNEKVIGRPYADIFYPVSVLDEDAVREVAKKEKVDFLLTVCADQVLEIVARVSEQLGLPWYIDADTANNVSKKSFMKKIFVESGVPTSDYVILQQLDREKIAHLRWPLIVKPVDSYSSRGVQRVDTPDQLQAAFDTAWNISRSHTVIVEEFNVGDEITVDVYVENGKAHVLSFGKLDKLNEGGKFIIHRASYPPVISKDIENQIRDAAQKIAEGFGLKDSPMLIQLITDGEKIRVIEFCSRTGGGIKFQLIKQLSGFDVVKAVLDLTMGLKPHVEEIPVKDPYLINQFLYCHEGVFDHLEGFEELKQEGVIEEYSQFKSQGTVFSQIRSSGDRIAHFCVRAKDRETLLKKYEAVCSRIRVVNTEGEDMARRDLLEIKE